MKINKKIIRIIIGIVIALFLVAMLTQVSLAYDWQNSIDDISNSSGGANTSARVTTFMGSVIYIVRIVAVGIAVIMLIVMGIRYVSASAGLKAEIKKEMPIYITGAVIIFAASAILKIIQDFIEGNFNSAV